MIQPIKINITSVGPKQVTLVELAGQLDSVTSGQVERQLDELLKKKLYKIVLNMSGVSYVSSAGWGLFIAILKEVKLNQGDLKLVGLTDDVMQVFQLLEVDFYLPTYKSDEEAIAAF